MSDIKPPTEPTPPAQTDPTFVTTLVNMVLSGCQMNAGVFELMGKGVPQFETYANAVVIVVNDGTYKVQVEFVGAPMPLEHPRTVPGFPQPPPPMPPMSVSAMSPEPLPPPMAPPLATEPLPPPLPPPMAPPLATEPMPPAVRRQPA